MDAPAWRDVLRAEFEGHDGTFMLTLRTELRWDQAAYERLVSAATACCSEQDDGPVLERWLAEGFWHLSWFPREWTSHESWEPVQPDLLAKLHDLSYWFFTGRSPYADAP